MSALERFYCMYERTLALVRYHHPQLDEVQQHRLTRELMASLDHDFITLLWRAIAIDRTQAPP